MVMGCCYSSPHVRRKYRDPGDLDEEVVPLRYFGTLRAGSNLVPDDISGLPSTHRHNHLASDTGVLLYEAEIDHGKAMRCLRVWYFFILNPFFLPILYSISLLNLIVACCPCDEICCWLRKEYSTRSFFRVYSNRIVFNEPRIRCPWGFLGCGSWNSDAVTTHPFDRGAFGFQHVRSGTINYLCCLFPVYGSVVARHRCQCFGPVWNRMFSDCGGWWCDEWLCQVCFCSYQYQGLSNADEAAFAASIALQAYFEGRTIDHNDMILCIKFWKEHIAEQDDPVGRKRSVCCDPCCLPCPNGTQCYKMTHMRRKIPYSDECITPELSEVYDAYDRERLTQIEAYKRFHGPVRHSTWCRSFGCRRCFGRRGCCFCTEGCKDCNRRAGEPAPPFEEHDFDDDWDASAVLMEVLGKPPGNVVIRRWRWNPELNKHTIETYPEAVPGDNMP